jgi:hypothetical protein
VFLSGEQAAEITKKAKSRVRPSPSILENQSSTDF